MIRLKTYDNRVWDLQENVKKCSPWDKLTFGETFFFSFIHFSLIFLFFFLVKCLSSIFFLHNIKGRTSHEHNAMTCCCIKKGIGNHIRFVTNNEVDLSFSLSHFLNLG